MLERLCTCKCCFLHALYWSRFLSCLCRKKEHTKRLQAELSALRSENDALQQLLREMNATGVSRDMCLCWAGDSMRCMVVDQSGRLCAICPTAWLDGDSSELCAALSAYAVACMVCAFLMRISPLPRLLRPLPSA